MGVKRRVLGVALRLRTRLLGEGAGRRWARSATVGFLRTRSIEVIYMLAFVIFASGIVNTILEGLRPEYAGAVILPSRSAQTVSEAIINMFVIFLGIAGAYLAYRSGRQAARRRISSLYLVSGVTALLVALLIGLLIINVKT